MKNLIIKALRTCTHSNHLGFGDCGGDCGGLVGEGIDIRNLISSESIESIVKRAESESHTSNTVFTKPAANVR